MTLHKADGDEIAFTLPLMGSIFSQFSKMNDLRQMALSIFTEGGKIFLLQDDNNDAVFTEDEFYELSDHVGDQLPPQELRRVLALNNRSQLLIRGENPVDVPVGPMVRNTPKDYLLKPEIPWLVMVALAYDNTTVLSATDMQERLNVKLNDLEAAANNENVQIVALVDTPTMGDSAYYVIKPDDDDTTLGDYEEGVDLFGLGELDITDPGALIQFVDWARSNFPGTREILMLDGAAGPGGLMIDDTSASAQGFMTMNQLQVALSAIGEDGRLNLLVLNNPHLAMLEVGFSVREGSRYMLASQPHIWFNESGYRRMIERLPPAAAGVDTRSVVINLTNALGASRTFSSPTLPVATSAVDLDFISGPLDLANLMALALNANLPLYSPHIQTTLESVQYFDTNGDLLQTTDDTLIDLIDFYILLQSTLTAAGFDQDTDPLFSADLQTALDETFSYVVHNVKTTNATVTGNMLGSFGVSIMFPPRASHFYDGANYSFASGAIWNSGPRQQGDPEAPAWGQLLVNYFALNDPDGDIDTELPQPRVADTLPDGVIRDAIFASGFQ